MRKIYFCLLLTGAVFQAGAQSPEDALRISWNPQSGTARFMSIGGAMTGLGGEISAAHTNPAGMALYKTNEFVLSPGFNFLSNKAEYRGTAGARGKQASGFNVGTSGLIIGGGTNRRSSSLRGGSLAFTATRLADFNYNLSYKGYNNMSSGAERYAEEFSDSRLTIDNALNSKYISLVTRMALYTYLIDTMTIGGINQVVAMPEFTTGLNQENTIESRGGITEYAATAAFNIKDKFFLGGSIALPVVNYDRNQTYKETDATSVNNNRFASYTYKEELESRGYGLNMKLGMIYRPVERIRLGLTIHTPSFYTITDRMKGSLNTNTENYNGDATITESAFTNGASSIESKYNFNSPWKISGGFSYVFREVENVKRQRAFIAADIDYVTYRSMKYSAVSEGDVLPEDEAYYDKVNNNIKNIYRNAINFRLGGEVKFNTIMVRLGGAFMGNPNKDKSELKSNRIMVSGGLGYRHKGIFIDLAYVHHMNKEVNFPYRLSDKANTFAPVKGTGGSAMLTFGVKF